MKDFKDNNCRLCRKVFCCKKCREKHETKQHKIFTGCEICVYGKTVISSTSQNVIAHIKTAHWPLNCLICKRLFGTVEELFQHLKCPLSNSTPINVQNSPYTPQQSNPGYSPALFAFYVNEKLEYDNKKLSAVSNLATSTPMLRKQGNNLLEKIQEVIVTPIDCSENTKENNMELSSLKRKVTFCDTPITESFCKKSKNNVSSVTGGSTFYTATEDLSEINMTNNENMRNNNAAVVVPLIETANEEKNNKIETTETTSVMIQSEEKTLWINAVNISTTRLCNADVEDESSLDFHHISDNKFFTPMAPKKKINIVAPSPMVNSEKLSIKFEGPIQISSTPNNSIIPVKSAPDVRDIFRPSTSKSDLENWGSVDIQTGEKFGCFTSESSKDGGGGGGTVDTGNATSGKFWTSVTTLVKNVLHGFSTSLISEGGGGGSSTSRSLKRYYSDQDLLESPNAKRYKVTDVRCRRTIRDMTPINRYMQSYRQAKYKEVRIKVANSLSVKTFADKATQTDD